MGQFHALFLRRIMGFFSASTDLQVSGGALRNLIRTPLIIKVAEKIEVRRISATIVNIDIYPTLRNLARLPIQKSTPGMSLVPLLTGRSHKTRSEWL